MMMMMMMMRTQVWPHRQSPTKQSQASLVMCVSCEGTGRRVLQFVQLVELYLIGYEFCCYWRRCRKVLKVRQGMSHCWPRHFLKNVKDCWLWTLWDVVVNDLKGVALRLSRRLNDDPSNCICKCAKAVRQKIVSARLWRWSSGSAISGPKPPANNDDSYWPGQYFCW